MSTNDIGRTRALSLKYGNDCRAQYCDLKRLPNHKFCQDHKYKLVFRGHEEQSIIPSRTISFCRKAVHVLAIENRDKDAWVSLMEAYQDRWDGVLKHVQRQLDLYYIGGNAQVRGTRKGHEITMAIMRDVGFDQTLEIWAAFQYLQADSPNTFRDDTSFRHQAIKYLRARAHHHASSTIDRRTGKCKSYSSPLYMVERDTTYSLILDIFGAIGLRLHQQIESRAERLRANKNQIDRALRQIT